MNATLTESETTAASPLKQDLVVNAWDGHTLQLGAPTARARILYAEDDASIRRSVQLMLGRSGYQVDTVADGADALLALETTTYDLLITDNQMPHLKGVDLIRKVRRARPELPVILASSDVGELPWPNCDALLPKPFGVEELLSVVSGVLVASVAKAQHSRWLSPWTPGDFEFTARRRQGLAVGC